MDRGIGAQYLPYLKTSSLNSPDSRPSAPLIIVMRAVHRIFRMSLHSTSASAGPTGAAFISTSVSNAASTDQRPKLPHSQPMRRSREIQLSDSNETTSP